MLIMLLIGLLIGLRIAMTKEELDSIVSEGFVRLLCFFVALTVLYCCAKVGARYFALPVEPVEPFRFQAGVKV